MPRRTAHILLLVLSERSAGAPGSGDDQSSWDRSTLPEGDEKVQAVREMFDAIAPRYDLVNRIMTFRLDVRWRRRAVAALALPPGSAVLDLASGTGDLCVDLAAAGHQPISIDLSFGMLRADRSGAPRVQADILRLPVADRPRRRRHVRLRAAQPGRPAGVLRRAGRESCGPAGASPCSTSASRRTASCASATASTSARSSRRSAGCCRTRPPTATCPAASPTCRRPTRCVGAARRGRVPRRPSPPAVARRHASCSPAPAR